jgi:hypothetical protein
MKPDFISFDFPAEVLAAAEKITLKDLIDTPFSQAWVVSAISNAQHFAREWPMEGDDDKLQFALFNLVRELPRRERQALFHQTTHLLRKNREERDELDLKKRAEFRRVKPLMK